MGALEGRGAVVTGASRGIGWATAKALAEAGAGVILAARSQREITALEQEIIEAGGRAKAVTCDVADYESVARAVIGCQDEFGRFDILVNNAGVIEPISHLTDSDPGEWAKAVAVNLTGAYHGMRAAIPLMDAGEGGVIVTISSGAAHSPLEGWSHYCAAKAGAAMLTRCADKEARDRGVRAVGLSPGTVATEMQRAIKESGVNPVSALDWSDHIPPEWVAQAVIWLCGTEGAEFAGEEVSLRDASIRRRIGVG